MTQSDALKLQERIRAIALLFGDAHERVLHEMLALLSSVTHADLAAFTADLIADREARQALLDAVNALTQRHVDLLDAVRRLREDVEALRLGLSIEARDRE